MQVYGRNYCESEMHFVTVTFIKLLSLDLRFLYGRNIRTILIWFKIYWSESRGFCSHDQIAALQPTKLVKPRRDGL
jgi:hypothetical protein